MLQVVVGVVALSELTFTGLQFIVLGLFFGSEVSAVSVGFDDLCYDAVGVNVVVKM